MKITGGTLRGRVVPGSVPKGVRPTSSRVREAMFSMVGQELQGITVLDGFAGSGLLTFEAASRGATVTTVERNRRVARQLRERAADLGVTLDLRVGDARDTLSSGGWDIVILDPPYADDAVRGSLQAYPAVRATPTGEPAAARSLWVTATCALARPMTSLSRPWRSVPIPV